MNQQKNLNQNIHKRLSACDFVMEELGIKNESDLGKSLYEDFLKERKTTLYNSVQLNNIEK